MLEFVIYGLFIIILLNSISFLMLTCGCNESWKGHELQSSNTSLVCQEDNLVTQYYYYV